MATKDLVAILDDNSLVEDVRRLSRVDNWKSAGVIARQWVVITACVAAAVWLDRWWLNLAAIIVIAAKQHALGVIVHDATHYRVFTSRFVSEYVANFFCAFPICMSIQGYRGEHQAHHLWTNTRYDPYVLMFDGDTAWQWPKTRVEAMWQVVADLSGLNTFSRLKMFRHWAPIGQWLKHRQNPQLSGRVTIDVVCSLFFWATIFSAVTFFGVWKPFLLLWAVPALTFNVLFNRLRWISEHPYDGSADVSYRTRHVQGSLLERIFIAPLNVNYHIAHHLFPAVPLYNLPKLHQRLLQHPAYQQEAERYTDYLGSTDSVRAELILE